mgnify:FL=1
MINNFCVCTLTHSTENRDLALKDTISSFIDNYKGGKFEWFIWVNISNPDIDKVLDWAVDTYSDRVQFTIRKSDVNLGPGGGINRLNELSKEYEYSFFIEGDWIHVPGNVAGISQNWIQNSITLLEENPDIDQIQYRRYLDDNDHRMYYMGWIKEDNIDRIASTGDRFYVLKERDYCNPPHLRKMSRFYEKGVFPLTEHYDENGNPTEHKGHPDWGQAEIKAWQVKLTAAWIELGNFVHWEDWPYKQDWNKYIEDGKGCGKFPVRGKVKCKYGFLTPSPVFCTLCNKNTGVSDINNHNGQYEIMIREIDKMTKEIGRELTDAEVINHFEQNAIDPVVKITDLINLAEHTTIKKSWRPPYPHS